MIKITTGVVCDICGKCLEIGGYKQPQYRKVRRMAEAKGWRCGVHVSRDVKDYCPNCIRGLKLAPRA